MDDMSINLFRPDCVPPSDGDHKKNRLYKGGSLVFCRDYWRGYPRFYCVNRASGATIFLIFAFVASRLRPSFYL